MLGPDSLIVVCMDPLGKPKTLNGFRAQVLPLEVLGEGSRIPGRHVRKH